MVWSYVERHNEAGRPIIKATAKGASGNILPSLTLAQNRPCKKNRRLSLSPWAAPNTTILDLPKDRDDAGGADHSLGVSASEVWLNLKLKPQMSNDVQQPALVELSNIHIVVGSLRMVDRLSWK